MPLYYLRYRSKANQIVHKTIRVVDKNAAMQSIQEDFKDLIVLKEKTSFFSSSKAAQASIATIKEFTSMMSMLLSSSLSVKDSLQIIGETALHKNVSHFAMSIMDHIEKGLSFHQSLQKEAPNLPAVYNGLVRIGERTGILAPVYIRLDAYLENKKKMRDSFIGALIYPAIILFVMIFGGSLLFMFVIPELMTVFADLGGSSNSSLAESLGTAKKTGVFFSIMSFGFLISFIISTIIRKRTNIDIIDKILLKIPFIGKIMMNKYMLDFSFAMESLTLAGITLDESLKEASISLSNRFLSKTLLSIRSQIQKGSSLSLAFKDTGGFDPAIVQWIAVGERTGSIDKIFTQLTVYYQNRTDLQNKSLTQLIEPIITVITGIIIVSVIVMFIVPLLSSMGNLLEN